MLLFAKKSFFGASLVLILMMVVGTSHRLPRPDKFVGSKRLLDGYLDNAQSSTQTLNLSLARSLTWMRQSSDTHSPPDYAAGGAAYDRSSHHCCPYWDTLIRSLYPPSPCGIVYCPGRPVDRTMHIVSMNNS